MMAQLFTGKQEIIALRHGYSGRSMLAQSLSGQAPWRAVTTQAAAVKHALSPYCYRCPLGLKYPSCEVKCARDIDELIRTTTTGQPAAFLAEPIQGVGGFITPPKEYFQIAVEIVRKHGGVFICDEVQTGFGRTGTLFAIEQSGVEPDLVCVAKSIAGGLPLSGVLGRAEIMDAPGDSAIGGTYVGNPVACVAALAVLEEIDRLDLCARAREIGEALTHRMCGLQSRLPQVGDVRGLGSMIGVEFVRDARTREPAPELATRVAEHALRHGLVLLKAGLYGNVIRNLAPLVITDEQLAEALDVLEAAIEHSVAAVAA
jgi:4-aminobutyrate aminotransferase-like enzyme